MASRIMELAIAIRGKLDGSVGASMRAASQEASQLRSQIANVNREMREAQRAAEAERRATGHVSEATMQRIAALQARLNQMTERRTQILEAQANVEQRGATYQNAKGKLMNAAMTTAVLAAPLVAATQAAMTFESAMADVRKVVDFDTPDGFQNMSNDILELSQRLPMAADDIAKIVAAGGQSGIAAGDLMQFAESATKMGIAFDITADQAGDMMAKWRTAFKLNQDQVVDLADKINYLGNTTAASAPLISDVVTRIGPLGEIGGVASGEIAALGASMVGTGVQSDVAATGIKNLILGMTAGEGATKSQADAFQKLGFDAATMAQRMQTDAKGAILDLFQALQSLPKDQQATVLADLFGKESIGAIAPLLSNLDNLADNFQKVGDASQYAGSMEAEYAARSQTTENQLQLAKNSLMAVAISIGSAILPAVNQLLSAIAPLASAFASWASENKGIIQVLVGVAAAIAGVVLASLAVYTVVAYFQYMQAMMALLTMTTEAGANAGFLWSAAMKVAAAAQAAFNAVMSANPIAIAVIAIMALVAALVYLYNNNETVRNAIISAWNSIKSAASAVWESIAPIVLSAWEAIKAAAQTGITFLQGVWATIQPYVVSAISGLIGIVGGLLSGGITIIGGILQGIIAIFGVVFNVVVTVVSVAFTVISAIISAAITVISAIISVLVPIFSAIWTVISTAAKIAFIAISMVIFAAISVIGAILQTLVAIATAVWNGIVMAAQFAWSMLAPIVMPVIDLIIASIQAIMSTAIMVWNAITAAAMFAWQMILAIVTPVIDTIVSYVTMAKAMISAAWDAISSAASAAWNSITGVVQGVIDTIMSAVDVGVNYVTEKWNSLRETLSHPIDAAVNFFSGGGDVATNAAGGIYNRGAFLTTFAENSAEAAIPLDGSARAISLWTQAGQMLGMIPSSVSSLAGQTAVQPQTASPVAAPAPSSSGGITVELHPNITVNGSGEGVRGDIQSALSEFAAELERNLPRLLANAQAGQRRLSYA